MSISRTVEEVLLGSAERLLSEADRRLGSGSRLAVIEIAASRYGQWSLKEFRRQFGADDSQDSAATIYADALVECLVELPLPPAVLLAALARPQRSRSEQRLQGAFYTDFRLAKFVAARAAVEFGGGEIVDLAAGSGTLLVATVLAICGTDRSRATELVARSVCAADLDEAALRACRASLAALCTDVDAISQLNRRLRRQDSLLTGLDGWRDIAPEGFSLIVGNPPWEKVKVSRHEFLVGNGHDRHYGADYKAVAIDETALASQRSLRAAYAAAVGARYPEATSGELDLYKAFIVCSLELLARNGRCCLLVPAGLIRSLGSEPLRRRLLAECGAMTIDVIDNKARFFAIDSRFKFLAITARKRRGSQPIKLGHAIGEPMQVRSNGQAQIDRVVLSRIRSDLSIPEVRNEREWELLVQLHERALYLDRQESPWQSEIMREVDMTNDRSHFVSRSGPGRVPLIEGRMVAQHRFGAKVYRSGSGRRAVWEVRDLGASTTEPQFHVPLAGLPTPVIDRIQRPRVGYCDITGQTNERSIIAARVPADVVCGNKVPTITFASDSDARMSWLFLAIANSLAFDWLARRLLTTSVNYFVLRSIPLPPIDPATPAARQMANLARDLARLDASGRPLTQAERWRRAEWRAEIDVAVARAWSLEVDDLALMFLDFPLLDRGQPALPGERRSTVTRDLALTKMAASNGASGNWANRADSARKIGALAYVPSEYAHMEDVSGRSEASGDLLAGIASG